jgi:arylsulfatase A-like enzyme
MAPNLLLVTLDQCRGDVLGPRRLPFVRTPHLDALAREATLFACHYAQATPCGPARASLLTGLYPHKHRSVRNGVPLDRRHPTLFTELRRAGYRPTLFGYTDTTADPRALLPGDPDLGEYENICPGLAVELALPEPSRPWLAHLAALGHVVDPDGGRHGVFAQRGFGEATVFDATESEAAFLTDRFLAWLSVAGAAPWCAHLSYVTPHPPFAAPAPFDRLVDPAEVTPPVPAGAEHKLTQWLRGRTGMAGFVPGGAGLVRDAEPATVAQVRAIYAGMVAQVDAQLGRVFDGLRAAGAWDRTVVVVTADHGEMLFDHGLLGKDGFFDPAVHVPLILRDPRSAAAHGRVVEAFTESIDIMPTLLQAAGVAPPRNCDGRSLLGFCAGVAPAGWRDAAHWSVDFRDITTHAAEQAFGLPSEWCNFSVVRTQRLKYVHFAALPPVLFDLVADPEQLLDRAADTALRLEGLERLLTWRQRHEESTLTGFLAKAGVLYQDGAAAATDA